MDGIRIVASLLQAGSVKRREEWFVRWTRTTAEQKTVHMTAFEEGLCRVMYVAGTLEHERPFPLYRLWTLVIRYKLSLLMSFFLHYSCDVKEFPARSAPRVDAQASDSRVASADGFPRSGQSGASTSGARTCSAWNKSEMLGLGYTKNQRNRPSLFPLWRLSEFFSVCFCSLTHRRGGEMGRKFRWSQRGPTTGPTHNKGLQGQRTGKQTPWRMEIRRASILIDNALILIDNALFVQLPSSVSFFQKLLRRVVKSMTSSEKFRESDRDPQRGKKQTTRKVEDRLKIKDPW